MIYHFHVREVPNDHTQQTAGYGVLFPTGTVFVELLSGIYMTFRTMYQATQWLVLHHLKIVDQPIYPKETP